MGGEDRPKLLTEVSARCQDEQSGAETTTEGTGWKTNSTFVSSRPPGTVASLPACFASWTSSQMLQTLSVVKVSRIASASGIVFE